MIFLQTNTDVLTFIKKFQFFLSTFFPQGKMEWGLMILFTLLYGTLASYISLNYTIVLDNRIPWDAYFSFDNRAIVMTGGGFERHPLANYFFDYIRKFALLLSGGQMNSIFRLVLSLLSSLTISLVMVQIYKYLKNIIGLPTKLGLLIVVFFSLFSTNLLLSFTPETYTYTLLFLCVFNYYAALKLKKSQSLSLGVLTSATIALGGLTITNASKVFLPVLFEKGLFSSWRKVLNAAFRSVLAASIFFFLYLARLKFDLSRILEKTASQYEKFSQPKVTPIWDMVASWFFGGNVLFPSFFLRDYHNKKGFEYKALFMDVYTSIVPYVFIAVLVGLIIWSTIKNRKNTLVQVLCWSFAVDLTIHCILKFGLHTSYIYGGHFVFVYPLLIGWLLYVYRDRNGMQSFLVSLLGIMAVYLSLNNLFRMQEFFEFLELYYQVK